MTIRKRAEEALALYCDQNNLVLSSDEYDEMLFDIYSKYMDEYLANPPKSEEPKTLWQLFAEEETK